MGNKKHHSSKLEHGLDVYDSGNEDEMFAMSSAISKSKYSTSTVAQKKIKPLPSPEQSNTRQPQQLFFRNKFE